MNIKTSFVKQKQDTPKLSEFFKASKKTDSQQKYFARLLVNMIAIDMSAFSVVQNTGFMDLCAAFGYAPPHRKTMTKLFMKEFFLLKQSRVEKPSLLLLRMRSRAPRAPRLLHIRRISLTLRGISSQSVSLSRTAPSPTQLQTSLTTIFRHTLTETKCRL